MTYRSLPKTTKSKPDKNILRICKPASKTDFTTFCIWGPNDVKYHVSITSSQKTTYVMYTLTHLFAVLYNLKMQTKARSQITLGLKLDEKRVPNVLKIPKTMYVIASQNSLVRAFQEVLCCIMTGIAYKFSIGRIDWV